MNTREKYAAARKAAQDIVNKAKADGDRALTPEEREAFDAHMTEAQAAKAILDQAKADRESLDDLGDVLGATDEPADKPAKFATAGDRVVRSQQFAAMVAQFPDGNVPRGSRPTMSPVKLGGLDEMLRSFQNAVLTDPGLYSTPVRVGPSALDVIDLFKAITVLEDMPKVVEIDRETFTNGAAVYTEGSDSTKAESTLTYTPDTVTLAVIAHHINVTTQALKHNQILRQRINGRLINGVLAKLQAEVAATLRASHGYMQTQGYTTSIPVTLRKAVTKAMQGMAAIGSMNPVRVLIAAEDHEALDLSLLNAMVALAGQELTQTARIWRAEVVPVFGLPKGVAYVGDTEQVELYLGEGGATVSAGHVDKQFIQNRLTMLGEIEGKAAVVGGAALVATDLDPLADPDLS